MGVWIGMCGTAHNAISGIIVTFGVRAFQIPVVGQFDGYARIVKNQICESALEAVKFMIIFLGSRQRIPKMRWLNERNSWD